MLVPTHHKSLEKVPEQGLTHGMPPIDVNFCHEMLVVISGSKKGGHFKLK